MSLHIKSFTFNPYQENTFVIWDDRRRAAIIDPGCHTASEERMLSDFVSAQELEITHLLNTHGHVDHMLGNHFVKNRYDATFVTHPDVVEELNQAVLYGPMMGIQPTPSPPPDRLVKEGDTVDVGDIRLEVLFTPGHSAGHISFYHPASASLFSGDVLFYGSIGRTDLPGGHMPTLMRTILDKVLPLGDEVKVYCGHGPQTTVGAERQSNPFVQQFLMA